MCVRDSKEMRVRDDSNATGYFHAREFLRTNERPLAFIHMRATAKPSRGTP